jgi:hypothetical protein
MIKTNCFLIAFLSVLLTYKGLEPHKTLLSYFVLQSTDELKQIPIDHGFRISLLHNWLNQKKEGLDASRGGWALARYTRLNWGSGTLGSGSTLT